MADKFCTNCGTRNPEQTKFCASCGSPLAAAPPVQQPMGQPPGQPLPPMGQPFPPPQQQPYPAYPPQPQPFQDPSYAQPYPMAPPMPAAPPAKKKHTGLKVLLGFFGAIALLVVALVILLGAGESKDYYKIGGEKVPSVKLALGEKRKLSGAESKIENGASMKVFTYNEPDRDQALEMAAYVNYLQEKDGFLLLTDMDFSTPEAWCKLGRNAAKGYIIIVQVEYDATGYIITLVKQEGEVTPADGDDGPEPYGNSYGEDDEDETDPQTNSYQTPATQASTPASTQGGASGGMGNLTKSIFSAYAGGTYHLKTRAEGVVSEMYAKGGAMAMKATAEGTDMRIVYQNGKTYTIMEAQKMVMVSDIPAGTETPASVPDTNNLTYVGEGSGEFDGGTYRYEEYKNTNGDQQFFFVDGSTWKGIRSIINGKTQDMVVLAFDTNVPDSVFEIPSDYTMLGN
jgi:hypothetical protein